MAIVQDLSQILPAEYTAEPRVHLGNYFEIDVCAYETAQGTVAPTQPPTGMAMPTTTTRLVPEPTLVLEAESVEQYEYEVLIFDQSRDGDYRGHRNREPGE